MITIMKNVLSVNQYLDLRESVGWKKLTLTQAENALKNSIITITAFDGEKPVGMGRIVGDGVVIDYIQDLVVKPEYQRKNIGEKILNELVQYVKESKLDDTEIMLCLMCAKGRENFYSKFNFISRPTDQLGPGMIQYIR